MSGPNGTAVLDQVRDALQEAHDAGRPAPGRRALARAVGASEYSVRRALESLTAHRDDQAGDRDEAGDQPGDERNETGTPAGIPVDDQEPPSPPAVVPAETEAGPVGARPDEREPASTPRPWPLILIGLAAAVAVWGGWVELGHLTGFGLVQPLPGVWDELRINTAIVLPVGIEAYGGYALRTWLSSASLSERTRRFARWSALASLAVGAGAQVASHLMRAGGVTTAPPLVTVLVACVPVAVLGLATGLATLVRRDAAQAGGAG